MFARVQKSTPITVFRVKRDFEYIILENDNLRIVHLYGYSIWSPTSHCPYYYLSLWFFKLSIVENWLREPQIHLSYLILSLMSTNLFSSLRHLKIIRLRWYIMCNRQLSEDIERPRQPLLRTDIDAGTLIKSRSDKRFINRRIPEPLENPLLNYNIYFLKKNVSFFR